ncbi:MAG: ParB/RepB/Spo0J family partition protein [Anaerolineae bacterium]|nr:ParB/RepB/Spo0J family partition protein [Anaerolineae bacterium]
MARRSGLGKGLDALIPVPETINTTKNAANQPLMVSVDNIVPNPRQPRHSINDDKLQELADSIREHGIIQPLIVTHEDNSDQFVLIAGERRLRASRIAGLVEIPVLVREASEQESLELALIENVQRADLTPLETAEAYLELSESFALSHEDIAKRVGKSRVTVTNTLRLLKLPETVRQALAEERISEGHARALLGLATAQSQAAALATIIKLDLTVRETEQLVRKMNNQKPKPVVIEKTSPEIQELEIKFRSMLGTKVNLRHTQSGGTITIHYYSDEELNHLVEQLLGESTGHA